MTLNFVIVCKLASRTYKVHLAISPPAKLEHNVLAKTMAAHPTTVNREYSPSSQLPLRLLAISSIT